MFPAIVFTHYTYYTEDGQAAALDIRIAMCEHELQRDIKILQREHFRRSSQKDVYTCIFSGLLMKILLLQVLHHIKVSMHRLFITAHTEIKQ